MKIIKKLKTLGQSTLNILLRPNGKIDLVIMNKDKIYTVTIEVDDDGQWFDATISGDLYHKSVNDYILENVLHLGLALKYYRYANKLKSPCSPVSIGIYKRQMKHIKKILGRTHYLEEN